MGTQFYTANTDMKIKLALLLASSLTMMAGSIVAPSLPAMALHYVEHANAEFLAKLVLTIPSLFIAVFALVIGALVNKIGRLNVLSISLALYAISGVSGFFLDGLYAILVGRALLGIAVAGIMTSVSILIGDYFSGDERNRFLGFQSMLMALGGVAFVILGGILAVDHWRSPYLVYLSSFAVLAISLLSLKEPKEIQTSNNSLDTEAHPKSIVGVIMLATFVAMIVFFMVPVQVPFLLNEIEISSASLSGIAIATFTLGGAITSGLFGIIKKHLQHEKIYAIAFAVFSIGYGLISHVDQYSLVLLCLFISGLGGGFLLPNGTTWLLSIIPLQNRGMMMGFFTSVMFLGQFLSPIVIQPVINHGGVSLGFSVISSLSLGVSLFFVALMFYRPFVMVSNAHRAKY